MNKLRSRLLLVSRAIRSAIMPLVVGCRANVAILFAASSVMVISAMGAGVDLMRAYVDQQKISEVTALACQYATRPSVVLTGAANYAGSGSPSTFDANLKTLVTTALHSQFTSNSPSYNLTPVVTGTVGGSLTISLTSSVATEMMTVVGFHSIGISATSDCHTTNTLPQVNNNNTLIQETFASTSIPNTNTHYIVPSGTVLTYGATGTISQTTTFPATPGFTGTNGSQWYIMGYCMELDPAGVGSGANNVRAPGGGQNSAELDCDNGSHSSGNSSISTQVYLEAGNYELRYYYAGRVDYPNYDPLPICGSSAADVSWANDTETGPISGGTSNWAGSSVGANSLRTNQINVYLDLPLASGAPPTHKTLDGTQTLAGSNLIDECVYAPPNGDGARDNSVWIQRSVRIYVTTASFYWLSFAADGANDSFGGQIDDILLCQGTCTGTVQDNFPSPTYNPYYPGGSLNTTTSSLLPDWLNPNGMNMGLFTDTFESPGYSQDGSRADANQSGNLNSSKGTSGTSSGGWPAQTASGYFTVPINEVYYGLAGAEQGSQYVDIAGYVYGPAHSNRLTGRPLLLAPGYYNLSYYYISDFVFSGVTFTECGATPSAVNLSLAGSASGTIRNTSTSSTEPYTVNALGVFLANAQIVSTPNSSGVTLAGTSSYTNPDSNLSDTPPVTTTSTTATVPPDAISATNYTVSTVSALLDICGYSPTWTQRSINFEIQKTGIYWLMFSSQIVAAQSSGAGGAIDDVVVTALGSPAMTSPPSNPVVVPVGAPQPGSALTPSAGAGYYIIADPLTYPAPMQ